MSYIAEPLQRAELKNLSNQIRQSLGMENELYFPAMPFLEKVMPILFPWFQLVSRYALINANMEYI